MSDLSELFARNPLNLSDLDIEAIIKRLREQQAQFELGARAPVVPKPKSTKTQNLLKDLGLA